MTDRPTKSFSRLGGAVIVDFVNTRPMGLRGPDERLRDFADLVEWSIAFGLLSAPEAARLVAAAQAPTVRAAHGQAIALREALRTEFAGFADGIPTPALIERINRLLAEGEGVMQLRRADLGPRLEFVSSVHSPPGLVRRLAHSAAEFLSGGATGRLRHCHGEDCVLWFIDKTRNASRQWCRMDRCGARHKAATYYRRKRLAQSAPG